MGAGLLAVCFLSTIITLLYFIVKRRYSFWISRGVPSIPPTFPFGNMKGIRKTIGFHDFWRNIYEKYKKKTPFVGIHMFINPAVVITDLDLAKNILIKDFNNFTDRGLYYNEKDDPLSAHLFALDDPQWKPLRHKISPTFTSGKMKFMFPTVLEIGEKFSEMFSDHVNKSTNIEMKEVLARFTTDVIGTCAFGIECNSLKDPNAEFRVMGKRVFAEQRHGPIGFLLLVTFPKLARRFRVKLLNESVATFFLKVVRDTVEYRKNNNVQRNDFLNLLMNIQKDGDHSELTVEEMAAQAFVFFLAGFETSSTTMAFCLYELAQNSDIQDKLRSEIRDVIKNNNGVFTYECMTKLNYMDQVIMETLRKYPVAPSLTRRSSVDYKFEGCDHIIPKNTSCFIPVYGIQHDPDLYPEPEKFDPDRFTADRIQNRHTATWLPFGDGPRNCIGLRFGKMQIRVGLVKLLSKFKFGINEDTLIPMKFDMKSNILNSEGGMFLEVEKL